MSWAETERYYGALRDIEAELDRRRDGAVTWRPEYVAIFGSPARLRLALERQWRVLLEAQLEPPGEFEQLLHLAAAHPGLVRALALPACAPQPPSPRPGATPVTVVVAGIA